MTGRRLLLLRHGRTAWNATGRAQGQADVELDELGHEQAEAVAPHLAALRPAALWTSDLARARQTCGYVERATGLSAKADERFREFDVGARQGLTMAEFAERFPVEYDAWVGGEDTARLPGAEVTEEVEARMLPALRECLDSLDTGETGVVVTHGASLKVATVGLLGWPRNLAATLRGVDNCGWVTLLESAGRLRMEGYNQLVGPAGDGVRDL